MTKKQLSDLAKNQIARIVSIQEHPVHVGLKKRLMELGMLEGSTVEMKFESPFGGNPFAVRVRGALLALRREEAQMIEVEVL